MKQTADVVVIGGGVVGCAVLYHLARRGVTDAVLLERQELTAGSSWHAAGNLAALTLPENAAVLQRDTIDFYPELEEESGQPCGVHIVGGLYLARTDDQTHQLSRIRSQALRSCVESDFITPQEAREHAPILNTDGVTSILYEPRKGYCDPASVTNAFAKAARGRGARIERYTKVIATTPNPDGSWTVSTDKGKILAGAVVNAAGLWGREVAAMAGIALPLMPVEHHYLVTDDIPDVANAAKETAHISEMSGGYYLRREGNGLLLGVYEDTCTTWAEDGTPQDFGHELLPDALERLEKVLSHVEDTIPCMGRAGIKRVVNGPMIFSPDLSPLVGPHPELRNYYCANGVMSGFNQGGAVGKIISDWIVDGEPGMDVHFWDVARFGDWADADFAKARAIYGYEHRQKVHYPFEEVDVGREKRTSALYETLKSRGAVHGAVFGLEHPLWYAGTPSVARDDYSFGRGNWYPAVRRECEAARKAVALFDITAFAKYRVSGPNAAAWMDRVFACRLPEVGATKLAPMLSRQGRMIGDFTVTRLAGDAFLLLGSGIMQQSHMRWFRMALPAAETPRVENISLDRGGLHLAGPRARDVLQALTNEDVSNAAFPFMTGRRLHLNTGAQVIVVRVSFTGELGFQIYCARADHEATYAAVMQAGAPYGLCHAGARAMGSLRIEKGFASWGADLSPDFPARACGLSRFIATSKGAFIGRGAYLEQPDTPARRFRQFTVEARGRDCFGGETIYAGGRICGHVTSGGYGHFTGSSLALGYIDTDVGPDTVLTIDLLGERIPARICEVPVYDPAGERMRG